MRRYEMLDASLFSKCCLKMENCLFQNPRKPCTYRKMLELKVAFQINLFP